MCMYMLTNVCVCVCVCPRVCPVRRARVIYNRKHYNKLPANKYFSYFTPLVRRRYNITAAFLLLFLSAASCPTLSCVYTCIHTMIRPSSRVIIVIVIALCVIIIASWSVRFRADKIPRYDVIIILTIIVKLILVSNNS